MKALTLPCQAVALGALLFLPFAQAAEADKPTSYNPVVITEEFDSIMQRMKAAKPSILEKHMVLLDERYDLSDKPAADVTMARGKPIQTGVQVVMSVRRTSATELTPRPCAA